MIDAFKTQLHQARPGCAVDDDQATPQCEIRVLNWLIYPLPTFFTLNLTWLENPSSDMILRLLVSIPQVFRPESLYDSEHAPGDFYALRGMIVFTGNHYYAYML